LGKSPVIARFSVRRTSAQSGLCCWGGGWAFAGIAWPNKSVKGTRRPLAILEFGFLSRFGGFAWLSLAARPLP